MADEIIRELWRIKDEIAKEYGDIKSFVKNLEAKKRKEGQAVGDQRYKNKTNGQGDQAVPQH